MDQKCSNYALINLLFSLCRSIWIIDLSFVLVLIPELQHAHLTFEVLQIKECTPTPFSFIVSTFRLTFEFFKEFEGVSKTNFGQINLEQLLQMLNFNA